MRKLKEDFVLSEDEFKELGFKIYYNRWDWSFSSADLSVNHHGLSISYSNWRRWVVWTEGRQFFPQSKKDVEDVIRIFNRYAIDE